MKYVFPVAYLKWVVPAGTLQNFINVLLYLFRAESLKGVIIAIYKASPRQYSPGCFQLPSFLIFIDLREKLLHQSPHPLASACSADSALWFLGVLLGKTA